MISKSGIFAILAVWGLLCGTITAQSPDSLSLYADYATFFDPATRLTYAEINYSLYRHQLGFIGADTLNYRLAGVLVTAEVIKRGTEQVIDQTSTYFFSKIPEGTDETMPGLRLFDKLVLPIEKGAYYINITAVDDVSKRSGFYSLMVKVPDYTSDDFISSDIELAHFIKSIDPDSDPQINDRLLKEDRMVLPNPTAVYAGDDSLLYLYCELYNLSAIDSGYNSFFVQTEVKDINGTLVKDYGKKKFTKPGSSAVFSDAYDISLLRPGTYTIVLTAVDMDTRNQTVSTSRFAIAPTEADRAEATLIDVETLSNISWYYLGEAEKIQIKKMSAEGQLNFLKQFWRGMDDDPTTPENPVFDEAVRRYAFANEYFETLPGRNDGWRTDRGRVYMMYGPYDRKVELPIAALEEPLIKWEYFNLGSGVIFIFVHDEHMAIGDFELKHSTHPRELANTYWERLIEGEYPEEKWEHGDDSKIPNTPEK